MCITGCIKKVPNRKIYLIWLFKIFRISYVYPAQKLLLKVDLRDQGGGGAFLLDFEMTRAQKIPTENVMLLVTSMRFLMFLISSQSFTKNPVHITSNV